MAISDEKMPWGWTTLAFLAALVVLALVIVYGGGKSANAVHLELIVAIGILLALCITAGKFVKGRSDGILIDERNRISLSRMQWVMWFMLVIAAYFVASMFNIANGNDFPTIDSNLLILLGLSSGTAVVSNVVTKAKQTPTANEPDVPAIPNQPGSSGTMSVKAAPVEASWADLYKGEEVSNDTVVDTSRLQKLVLTVLLGVAFFFLVWKQIDKDIGSLKVALPALDEKLLWLLGISQAAYIAAKSTPKPPSPPPTEEGVQKMNAMVRARAMAAPRVPPTQP
jgi:hypothetical protein